MKQSPINKKGQSANYIVAILLALALGAIAYFVTGFFLALGANLNTELGEQNICATGYTQNASAGNCYLNTNNSVKSGYTTAGNISLQVNEGFLTYGDNMPLIAQVIIAVIVILLVMGLFFLFGKKGAGGM